ncbi:MAG: phenylacetic acid degradation bifunctional protein PaaZ [Bacteroidia bacterium]|nr:phenylacetic acid degradation bifunctional protein PaaZ [Bacteroidia bacterium]NNF29798.1 phenylacetic acid degradation bifunctional protein PaaZ [Flavobacteriaceae bacterium]MBT8276002.1 phenylacetic acid degradation bifunctional protein PaaZ [Bacteroidia bacterium]NNJ82584.1 phenylacetic acid degradation bifunctional protein PaaZ [Flavobacteriaceae bacterium]NNK55340.1 phenylacetic acid degradation bifunctional protein PaaZ [Flavobacteriaceae bacterium]
MNKTQHYVTGSWIDGSGEGAPVFDSVTGEQFTSVTVEGLDVPSILEYGRDKGEALRKMTFQQRGLMLKKLAMYLNKKKEQFYELSYRTGATKVDSWIDIEGGFGNLFANASLRKLFPNQSYHVEGEPIDLSRGGRFMAHHIMVPKRGVVVHINAFNFPVWGMLEKCAVNWMAGMPAIVLPAPQTAYLAEAVVREIVGSGILPEGSIQLISGTAKNILDTVQSQDVVTFTGSASTGKILRKHPQLIEESVPFTMEADSLNASVLGEDAVPGTPEFDLFIKEVRKEMTVKAGQKCTAIRRIIVPEKMVEDVQIELGKQLDKVTIGDPRLQEVRMGALVSDAQRKSVREQVEKIAKTAEIVYGDLDVVETIGADSKKGAFLKPILLRENNPFKNEAAHITEAFGPVSTLMPYKDLNEAITLAQMGKGSLVSSIATYNDNIAKEYVIGAASHHGRILVLNRENARVSTGHGSPLPTLVHGGPGRAGGGEEMGGMRGVKHYLQRCAVQGTPTTLTEVTGIYQPKGAYKEAEQHPFKYHWEDIEPGMSLKTHKRTITDGDIVNFANLTWDHFYAHTDITSLDGSIFEKRTAHGYFLLAAAAGLFVYPNKGPVAANYGLEDCRFLRPIYHNDTIYVRLTCKQKIDREQRGTELPSGIVKWYGEVFDTDDELVAVVTVLTMVQKKQNTFVEMTSEKIDECLAKLTEDSKPTWGNLTPQHMLEHLEYTYRIAAGEIQDFEISTPERVLEKVHATLYNYKKMPQGYDFPLREEAEMDKLKHPDLATAKVKFLEARQDYLDYFEENPDARTKNVVFGELNRFEWYLLERKHLNHHFEQFRLI